MPNDRNKLKLFASQLLKRRNLEGKYSGRSGSKKTEANMKRVAEKGHLDTG